MVRLFRLMVMKGLLAQISLAVIMIASALSFVLQPALASTMTSPQCADTHASAMADTTLTMAGHEGRTSQSSCCNDNETSNQHGCGDFCVISCTNSTAADVPLNTALMAAPSHRLRHTNFKRPLVQFAAAFIPPPPRL